MNLAGNLEILQFFDFDFCFSLQYFQTFVTFLESCVICNFVFCSTFSNSVIILEKLEKMALLMGELTVGNTTFLPQIVGLLTRMYKKKYIFPNKIIKATLNNWI